MEQWTATVQLLGTLVTILGLIVVAPYAAGRMVPDVARSLRSGARSVGDRLARWLPFLRRDAVLHAATGAAIAVGFAAEASGRVKPKAGGTVEEQLDAIRRAMDAIHAELDGLREGHKVLRAEQAARLDQLEDELSALRREIAEQSDERGKLDARGFPLAAVGALVAGWPAAWLPCWLAVALILVAGGAGVAAVRWLRGRPGEPGAWGEVRNGWSDGWVDSPTRASARRRRAAAPDTPGN